MPAPLLFGAIADDLTGGTELASMLVARGVPTGCTVGARAEVPSGNVAHVIALKTRVEPAAEAVAHTLEAAEKLLAAGARQIFFKYCATFDSTPQGNIGPCAEALLERLGARATVFAPALCETGRTVYQGHMFGGSQLLSESPKRFDPLTPMTDSNLVRVLAAQSRSKVGLIPHPAVNAGADAIRRALDARVAAGDRLLIADTIYERDLAAIAAATVDLPLMTGNSSVAAHLPPEWIERGQLAISDLVPARLPAIDGPAAILAGSVADRTAEQLERFACAHPLLKIDLQRSVEEAVAEAAAFASLHLAERPFAIATTAPQAVVDELQRQHGRANIAAKAEAILAAIARILVGEMGLRRLIVAGGETAGAIVRSLAIERITMGAYEGPGLSRGIVETPQPLALMLKSGKLGGTDIFEQVLEAMRLPTEMEPAIDKWPPSVLRNN
ncbi:3-oxo-tetronate kinase [Mesorhizobium sp. ANAO-SY3R2]|uniref:3-oxo-tetronate kinase n=1 Tax=Mesorhizobium sp. ANAO-SY3R2 TaxID=3166644 RepID=UPI00366D0118